MKDEILEEIAIKGDLENLKLMIKRNGRRTTGVGKIRSRRIRSTKCVSWNVIIIIIIMYILE